MLSRLALAAIALSSSAPAWASSAAQVPEGSGLTLFALGAAGVLLGRRLSMRKADKNRDDS